MALLTDISSVYGRVAAVNLLPHQGRRYAIHVCGMVFPLRGNVKSHIRQGKRGYPKVLILYRQPEVGGMLSVDHVVAVIVKPTRLTWRTIQAAASEGTLGAEMLAAARGVIYINL